MKIARIVLVIIFVLGCASKGSHVGSASNEAKSKTGDTKAVSNQAPPAFLGPIKPVYVTTPGDPFFLFVGVECRTGVIDSSTFELVQPAPSFVKLKPNECVGKSMMAGAVIEVNPGNADLGTYFVQVIARPCG